MVFFGTLAKTKPQNFIRNILEVTKPQPIYQSDTSNKKSPLHHLRGFARKNTSITGKIYEKIE